MNDDIILDVRSLSVNFYTNQRCNKALRDVSFTLRKGKTLCLVGESGCGKSVAANSIMQLLPDLGRIEGGEIQFFGPQGMVSIETLDRRGAEMRRLRGKEIAMIFQDPMTALNPVFSIGYQISEMLGSHSGMSKRQRHERSIELLTEMGVPSPEQRVNEYPHQYSGGMRQRAMIAMAMACKPKVLIADEPTTALDVTIQAQIFDLMEALKRERETAILLITHDMGVVAEMADDVAVMYMGDIVESGTATEVLASPTHPYTRALLASIPVLGRGREQQLKPIRGMTPNPYRRPAGCQFEPRCDHATKLCKSKMPPLEHLADTGHTVRCFNHKELPHA